MTRKIQRM